MKRHALPCDVRGLECICDVENILTGGHQMTTMTPKAPRNFKTDQTLKTVMTLCSAALLGLGDAEVYDELKARFYWKDEELSSLRDRLGSFLDLCDSLS